MLLESQELSGSGAALRMLVGDLDPPLRPRRKSAYRRVQFRAGFGQLIGDADRRTRVDGAAQDALALELAKPLGQKPVGKPRHACSDLVEALRPGQEDADYRPGPSAAHELDRSMEARAEVRQLHPVPHFVLFSA